MASKTVVLITGANRGLGKGLAELYLARSNHTVIAAVRDPKHSTCEALRSSRKGPRSSLVLVKIDSSNKDDPAAAVKELESSHGISHIDVVIANAGISKGFGSVSQIRLQDMEEMMLVNVYAVVLLLQATLPLLNKAQGEPKFVTMSSGAGVIGDMVPKELIVGAYGTSKAALNYITRKIFMENETLCTFPIDPGWVQTDMGNSGAAFFGMEKAELTLEQSVEGMAKVISEASREKTQGNLMRWSGEQAGW